MVVFDFFDVIHGYFRISGYIRRIFYGHGVSRFRTAAIDFHHYNLCQGLPLSVAVCGLFGFRLGFQRFVEEFVCHNAAVHRHYIFFRRQDLFHLPLFRRVCSRHRYAAFEIVRRGQRRIDHEIRGDGQFQRRIFF